MSKLNIEDFATGESGDLDLEKAWWRKAEEIFKVFCNKQHDYGPHNIGRMKERKTEAVAIRANDKMARLLNIHTKGKGLAVADETKRDTAIDLADYGIIWMLCADGDWPDYTDDDLAQYGFDLFNEIRLCLSQLDNASLESSVYSMISELEDMLYERGNTE